tara:strand:+ start:1124 stop:1330 length:207 start_codon:yes stop_codon:yes gene_type:complete
MRLEESIREAKMKGLSLYGSEINNIKGKDGKVYNAKPVLLGGKLAYKVTDQFGKFDTLTLKKFAAKFG